MKHYSVRQLTLAAVIGALYAVLTLTASVFGITYGPVQCRVSEALCVLPFFFPEAKWGLFVGCLIANLPGYAAGRLHHCKAPRKMEMVCTASACTFQCFDDWRSPGVV